MSGHDKIPRAGRTTTVEPHRVDSVPAIVGDPQLHALHEENVRLKALLREWFAKWGDDHYGDGGCRCIHCDTVRAMR